MRPKNFLIVTINSLVYFLVAFLIVKNLTNLYGLVFAKLAGYKGTLFWYGFTIDWKTAELSSRNLILIYLVSFLIVLVTGIVFEQIYARVRRYEYPVKILFLWIFIISVSRFAGFVMVGALKYYGVGVFFDMFHFSMGIKVAIAVASMVLLMLVGFFTSSHVRASANVYFDEINESQLTLFFTAQILLPILLAFPIIFAYKIPHHNDFNYLDSLVYLSLFAFAAGLFIGRGFMTGLEFAKSHSQFKFFRSAFLFLVLLMLIFRVGLNWGITF